MSTVRVHFTIDKVLTPMLLPLLLLGPVFHVRLIPPNVLHLTPLAKLLIFGDFSHRAGTHRTL